MTREDKGNPERTLEGCDGRFDDGERDDVRQEEESVLVDVGEAARMCRVSVSMFYKMIKAGRTPRPIKFGKLMRWPKKELSRWIDAGCPLETE